MSLLVHPPHVGLVVLVAVLQGLVSVLEQLLLLGHLELLEGRNRAQLIEDVVGFLEAKGRQEELEVFQIQLSLSLPISNPQKTADLLRRNLPV